VKDWQGVTKVSKAIMPDGKAVDFFGSQADEWVALYTAKTQFQDRLALFVGGVRKHVPGSGRILDFGCGPGVMSAALACEGYEVIGVDGSERMIHVAEQQSPRHASANVRFEVMDSESFSLTPQSYDAVVCSSVLEYVKDDEKLLRNLAGVLRPGGILLISVPHSASYLGRIEDAMAGIRLPGLKRGPGRMDLKYSMRRYNAAEFLSSLRSLSLNVLDTTFFEIPFLGRCGIRLSRLPRLGMMLLVTAMKSKPAELPER
jgi:2-polyprenyl-3-methyl-5-hydroxy-6-metoxy-1,4-benzoquinol methylase